MDGLLYSIIAILILAILYLLFKKERRREIVDYEAKEREMVERLHQKELEVLKQIELEVENEKAIAYKERLQIHEHLVKEQENLKNYKNAKIKDIENQIELYKQEELHKIQQELLSKSLEEKRKQDDNFIIIAAEFEQRKNELNQEINHVSAILTDLKEKRERTLDIIKEEERIKAEADFYKILLSQADKEDITQLRAIEKYLNNKDVLRKLIYKTFVEPPLNEMLNRISAKTLPGIYKITNLNNNMCYIGQSTNVRNRIKAHVQASLGISSIANQLVHDKMAEEGLDSFSFQILEECEKDKLNAREKYWIEYYASNEYGYNRTSGGAKSHN